MKRYCLILVGVFIAATSAHAGEPGVKQTIAYVQKLQTENGGFRPFDPGVKKVEILPTLRATSAAVRALHYLGADVPNKAACAKFVESCHDPRSGGFGDAPDAKPDVFTTAVGLMAVTELKMPADKYSKGAVKYLGDNAKSFEDIRIAAAGMEALKEKSPKAEAWRDETLRKMNRDGSWGSGPGEARDTASHVVTLLRLDAKPTAGNDQIIKLLKAGQRQNGGWGKAEEKVASDLETTYRVMRCFVMLKARPDNVEGVRSFVAKCRNADGGYAVMPGQTSSVSGTYFAAIITHWLKE